MKAKIASPMLAAGLSTMAMVVMYIGRLAGDEVRRRTAAPPPNAL